MSKINYQARGVMYIPDEARWLNLMQLPESTNIGKEINDAMRTIEAENYDLKMSCPGFTITCVGQFLNIR